MSDEIVQVEPSVSEELPLDDSVEVGQWYWLTEDNTLVCVTHVGSNYVEVESPSGSSRRVHFNGFDEHLVREPHPDEVIDGRIAKHQAEVNRLLGRVREETARLGMAPRPKLEGHNETKALAKLDTGMTYDGYKAALVRAKEETLPDLFERIERESTGPWPNGWAPRSSPSRRRLEG